MKVKILDITEAHRRKGFKANEIYNVSEIEIDGDSSGYDVYYKITSSEGNDMWIIDLLIEEINIDDKYIKFLSLLKEMDDDKVQYKFNFKIEL